MAQLPVSVDLNQLLGQFTNYQDPNRIRQDVLNVSRHSRTLVPKRGKLTLNTGQECQLLMLEGTVPTFFRGAQYHTPVEIYITENYPLSPPMCYIRPVAGMSLKVGHKHVDQSGLVYLPYLHEWSARSHNLVQLCAHMSSVFGAEPPLFASNSISRPASTHTNPSNYRNPPAPSPTPTPSNPTVGLGGRPSGGYPYSARQHGSPTLQPQPVPSVQTKPALPPRPSPEQVREEKEKALTLKLQGELQATYNQLRAEMDSAFETQADLEDHQLKVEEDVEELSRRKKELARLVEVSKEREAELDAYLRERENEGEPSVDDLIEPKDALSQQMLELVAENAALEDALYYLDQGLTDGVITVDVFMKEVRRLARKQFVARATMKKVERAQEELLASRATFAAEQVGNKSAGVYPHLSPQQQNQNGQRGYMSGPPPGYTPAAVGGSSSYAAASGYSQPPPATGRWGSAAAARGVYPPSFGNGMGGVGRGYGAQTPYTQRR